MAIVTWEDYHRRYNDFVHGLGQSRVISAVCADVLTDFPKKLPDRLKTKLTDLMYKLATDLNAAVEELHADGSGSKKNAAGVGKKPDDSVDLDNSDELDDFLFSSMMTFVSASLGKQSLTNIDFSNVVFSQQLVMIFAHLEAFVADSLRVICHVRPEILKSDKKLDWKTLIDLGNWDDVIDHLSEQYVFNCGWGSILDSVKHARDKLGLRLDVPDDMLDRITSAELLRNILVHNGGRASAEYLRRTGRTDIQLGEQVPIDREIAGQAASDGLILAGELCLDVAEVHLGQDRNTISGVWLRGTPAS